MPSVCFIEASVKTVHLKGKKYDTETAYVQHPCVKTALEK